MFVTQQLQFLHVQDFNLSLTAGPTHCSSYHDIFNVVQSPEQSHPDGSSDLPNGS